MNKINKPQEVKYTPKEDRYSERILLLTDIPPCKNHTGGIMLSQMIRFFLEEKHEIACFCVMNPLIEPILDTNVINDIAFDLHYKPEENFKNSKYSSKKYYSIIKQIEKKLIEYIQKNKITKVWCTLQGEVITLLLEAIADQTKIEYVVQIWDPIEWWINENRFKNKRKNRVLKQYEKIIKKASYCIVSSFAMRQEFEEKYKVKCIEVMPPLEKPNLKIDINHKDKSKYIIAMAGQIYAKEETEKLLLALEKMGWNYKGRQIYFHHYGMWFEDYIDLDRFNKDLDHIIINGFLPQHKLLEELSYADLLYCPYFFSQVKGLKEVATLSFPSKLISYMALKVPVLLHAPEYASPYIFLSKIQGGYLLNTLDIDIIIENIKNIMDGDTKERDTIKDNAYKAFLKNFTFEKVKANLFKAFNLSYTKEKKIRVLEVNNVDLPGRRFNGYDLQRMINNETIHSAKQIVTYKTSDDKKVVEFYRTGNGLVLEGKILQNEAIHLSVHSQLSLTSNILQDHDEFINANVVHYHLVHNTKLNLNQMVELCNKKPSILSIHDPWNFTGRCVHPENCNKWLSGCKDCPNLNNLFPLIEDNCYSLWKLKEKVYKKLDADIVVSTPFILDMLKRSPLTKHFKHVHLIPFGIDLNKFSNNISKIEARKELDIRKNDIVLFFRAQKELKGTNYIIEAMKELSIDKNITLLSCGEINLMNELKGKYTIIDLSFIDDDKMVVAYNACDIFLMPSIGESFGLMAIEAMACSRPVIVFDNSALPSVTFAPECGFLVENKNAHKLMEAIKYLIENEEERIRRGTLGRKLAEEHYDVNVYNKKMIDLYEKVYKRHKKVKKINNFNLSIDYSLSDVQKLICKLKRIAYNIFNSTDLPIEFLKHEQQYVDNSNHKIDYSLDSVQGVIQQFNDYVYDVIKVENIATIDNYNINFKNLPIIYKFLYLWKHDRPKLKGTIRYRLRNYKCIYKLLGLIYRIGSNIKKKVNFLLSKLL